jgi:2-iminoacetate synthase
MTFYDLLFPGQEAPLWRALAAVQPGDVERVLNGGHVGPEGFLTLLSPAARGFLEAMAGRAHALTVRNFGRVILLYTPLYLSNYCSNFCVYCGFAAQNRIRRDRLSLEEVAAEAALIRASGLRHLLVLTGESRRMSSVAYIGDAVEVLRGYFPSISIEVYPLETDEYRRLAQAGVDGLTLYQETYDRRLYSVLHPRGPKRDYRYRLEAPERACDAGIRAVNIGALLGLGDWRADAFATGRHADYLQSRYPDVEVSVSLPRLCAHEGSFEDSVPVTDRDFVQVLLALRIFLPRVGITISTRERAEFRDHLIPLGVTKMSAGSSTQVGGRAHRSAETGQFDITDRRNVPAIKQAIEARGYKAIFKDWHPLLDAPREMNQRRTV